MKERKKDKQTANCTDGRGALRPFIKWAGGKGQLLCEIRPRYPAGLGESITQYAEPFVGGGAVLFDILASYSPKRVCIGDINRDLINLYAAVRDSVTELTELLEKYRGEYIHRNKEERKAYYYEKRALYNDSASRSAERAALFIFLNKTCYNGLYRVNSKGEFNVPAGSYKNPSVYDPKTLRAVSAALQNVEMIQGDYRGMRSFIDGGTFVYIDPPYRPLSGTSKFTSYTSEPFGDREQRELACFARELDEAGAKVMISNSDPKNSDPDDDFFDELYKGFQIERVDAARAINSVGKSRGKISEIIIRNYGNTV